MRLHLLALGSLSLLAACAANEYSSVPEPKGEWVAVNPPGFQPLPPVRPLVHRVRVYHRPVAPLRTAQTAQAAAAVEAHP